MVATIQEVEKYRDSEGMFSNIDELNLCEVSNYGLSLMLSDAIGYAENQIEMEIESRFENELI